MGSRYTFFWMLSRAVRKAFCSSLEAMTKARSSSWLMRVKESRISSEALPMFAWEVAVLVPHLGQ